MADHDNKLDYEVPTERKATKWVFRIAVVIVALILTLAVLAVLG